MKFVIGTEDYAAWKREMEFWDNFDRISVLMVFAVIIMLNLFK